jgi:hypothetical protein
VRVDDPLVIQLREMSRVDDDLAEDMNRLTNRMREQLHRYYPALLRLSRRPTSRGCAPCSSSLRRLLPELGSSRSGSRSSSASTAFGAWMPNRSGRR